MSAGLVAISDQRHRFEVVKHVVREIVNRPIHDMRSPMADTDRIAIGRRARDAADAERAGRAGRVLDDHRLPKRLAHALGKDARDRVGRPARRERHHQGDGPHRIGLRLHPQAGAHTGRDHGGKKHALHSSNPIGLWGAETTRPKPRRKAQKRSAARQLAGSRDIARPITHECG